MLFFLSFFSSCCLVSVLPFFEERSSSDSNPHKFLEDGEFVVLYNYFAILAVNEQI